MRILAWLVVICCLACDSQKTESSEIARKYNDNQFDNPEQKKVADFVVDAVAEHYASIRFAQLAMNKTSNPDVREVAATIELDQAQKLKQFTGYANKKGISVPTEESESAKDNLNDLANQQRTDFDEKWCGELAKRNERDIQAFESMWEKTSDAELKELINQTLPEMRTHLVKLRSCQEKLAMK